MLIKQIFKTIGLLSTAILVPQSAYAEVTKEKVLEELDKLYDFRDTDYSMEVTIVHEEPGKDKTAEKARFFNRQSENKFTIIFLEPNSKKGQGFLQIDNAMWFYDSTSRKFSIHSRKESVGSSNTRANDLEGKSFSSQYEINELNSDKLGIFNVHVISLKATKDTVEIPRMKLWIREDNYLILKQEEYSLSDRLLRTTLFPSYSKVGERFFPAGQLIVDNVNVGEKTQLTFTNISFATIPDEVFTRNYLERVSR